jgi:hypothetical protein
MDLRSANKQALHRFRHPTVKELIMKKLSVIALSLLAAGAAMAQGLTREQVIADLVKARNSGELAVLNSENPDAFGRIGLNTATTGLSREAVVAELQRARASGELEAQRSESYAPRIPATSTRTRAEVLAELQRARDNGELEMGSRNQGGYAHLDTVLRKQAQEKLLAGQPAKSAQ